VEFKRNNKKVKSIRCKLYKRLQPPLAPLRPGSYDLARDMYFQGIGASGFVMGAIKIVDPPRGGGIALRYAALMQELRDAIDARIRVVLSGDSRAIATALLTGRRDAITTPVNDAMFNFRLSHGHGRRRRVLRGARAIGVDPGLDGDFPDQEMVGCGGARRGRVLSSM
jgi:predicted membrane metal-binding protein